MRGAQAKEALTAGCALSVIDGDRSWMPCCIVALRMGVSEVSLHGMAVDYCFEL